MGLHSLRIKAQLRRRTPKATSFCLESPFHSSLVKSCSSFTKRLGFLSSRETSSVHRPGARGDAALGRRGSVRGSTSSRWLVSPTREPPRSSGQSWDSEMSSSAPVRSPTWSRYPANVLTNSKQRATLLTFLQQENILSTPFQKTGQPSSLLDHIYGLKDDSVRDEHRRPILASTSGRWWLMTAFVASRRKPFVSAPACAEFILYIHHFTFDNPW